MALGKNKKIINLVQSISEMKEGIWGRYAGSYDNECLRPESWT